jgi:hypothetical protein
MKVGASTLRVLLENNVLEIKFKRRRPKPGAPATRRMLCTNSPVILKSDAGRQTLHYKPTSGTPKYSPASKNIVIAWDIFKQDYRAISVDNCELISQMPVSGDGSDFWEYFNSTIHPMTTEQKQSFFNV